MKMGTTLALLLAFIVFGPAGHAQSPNNPTLTAARQSAERALRAGRFDEVASLTQSYPKDEAFVVLAAQALIAKGEYAKAEALLQPIVAERPAGDAALELGLLQLYVGRRPEGRRTLQLVLLNESSSAGPRDYARAGRASRALGRFEDANALYREASTTAPNTAAIETAWGDLLLEKYNTAEAVKSYQVALKADADYGPAIVGMAKAIVDENPPAARKYAERALQLNPNDIGAQLVLADLAVDEDKRDDARAAVAKALAINPNSLEAHALKAAIAFVDGQTDEYQNSVTTALKINPLYGDVYRVVGAVTARYYRFEDAVQQVRRGLGIDRDNSRAQADLGMHLMRTGDELAARRALEVAFRADPYNVLTFNLLELLDKLDKFQTIRDGDLIIKVETGESGVMREYVPALAKEALAALSKRWDFVPKGPILIEMFPEHDDFAVRTLGLPGMLGALGACFGRVVTLDSPKARPPGEFNWGATLWHELAHVITLQLSNQRIPRWLTEGISVFEETRGRAEWGREMELAFARAMDAKEILTVKDLNAGFQNPRTISLAYYEASLLVEHIVKRFGEPKLRALVQSFADGIDTETALRKVLGVEIESVQASFDTFLGERFGALRRALKAPDDFSPDMPADKIKAVAAAHPESYPVQMALGRALRGTDPGAAIQAYERAATLVPMSIGSEGAYMQIVEVALARSDKAKAAEALEKLTAQDHTDVEAARQLVGLLDPVKDAGRLKTALQRVVAVDPFDAPSHTTLGRMALASGQAEEATRMFKVAIAAGPIDRAAAQADLAEGFYLGGQRDEAKRAALAALEIAPTFSRAQDLLLKLIEGPKQ
jgi:tetratricopeptide (TPR) repeat protein